MESKKMLADKRILVTGGSGFLGKNVIAELTKRGLTVTNRRPDPNQVFIFRSSEFNLENQSTVFDLIRYTQPDIIIHLAAKVGGIGANQKLPGTFFYSNMMMGVSLLEAARIYKVGKVVTVGTICAYPKYATVPFREEDLWSGYPEETNAPYGIAKKALLVQSQAYRQEFGLNAIYLLPVNLYGPGDNFNPDSSHVIPALIKKFSDAIATNSRSVDVWGTGAASREFLYAADAAEGIVLATEKYDKPEPVNLGSGKEITIKSLVEKIGALMGYRGSIVWDATKPDGQPRRCLDVEKAKVFGFTAKTSLEDGLKQTIQWYEQMRNPE
jgi:GDP-L-fucose synthase